MAWLSLFCFFYWLLLFVIKGVWPLCVRFLSSPLFSLFWLLINSRAPLPLSLFHSCYSHPLIHWRMSDPPSNPTHSPSTTPIPSSTSPHNANLFSASQLLNDGPPPRPQLPIELDGSSPRAHGLYYHLNLLFIPHCHLIWKLFQLAIIFKKQNPKHHSSLYSPAMPGNFNLPSLSGWRAATAFKLSMATILAPFCCLVRHRETRLLGLLYGLNDVGRTLLRLILALCIWMFQLSSFNEIEHEFDSNGLVLEWRNKESPLKLELHHAHKVLNEMPQVLVVIFLMKNSSIVTFCNVGFLPMSQSTKLFSLGRITRGSEAFKQRNVASIGASWSC